MSISSLPATASTPSTAAALPLPAGAAARRGWWLGVLGVAVFALTIPVTRLASGTLEAPQLPPAFIAFGRAALAGLLALAWQLAQRAPWPRPGQWGLLAVTAVGVVFGFPLCMGLAVQQVPAAHAAVVSGLLPMATAALGALWLGQRAGAGFWWAAAGGTGLVLAFAGRRAGGLHLSAADGLLLLAVLLGGLGYVAGARLSAPQPGAGAGPMPPQQVISWTLVLSLPLTLPLAWWQRPLAPASAAAWAGFVYLGVCSMWLGFFAWYRGLQLGGVLRVSQIQLVQPFLAIVLAVPLLGEPLEPATLAFAAAVMAMVLLSRRLAAAPPPARPPAAVAPAAVAPAPR